MNKTKKELFEENKKLKKVMESYRDFWEYDMSEIITDKLNKNKKILMAALCLICFLIGLAF